MSWQYSIKKMSEEVRAECKLTHEDDVRKLSSKPYKGMWTYWLMLDEDLRFKTLTDAVEHYGIQVVKQGDLHTVTRSEDQHKLIENYVLFNVLLVSHQNFAFESYLEPSHKRSFLQSAWQIITTRGAQIINSSRKLCTVCIKDRHNNITSALIQHSHMRACQFEMATNR